MESEAAAADRGATDRALVAVLFQGGLRRSEAAALLWGDVQAAADGRAAATVAAVSVSPAGAVSPPRGLDG